ncbi:histidinol dehydrogenase [candidate division BRC1 bacterium HGW-BRC1-1]|jgi:histidinol dehydrogenase|nr:MAG: histidinol dehydrogenase [candidate division BRC1 bacterium HGW-BRC1-1]
MKVLNFPQQRKAIEKTFARRSHRDPRVENIVAEIIAAVEARGDAAILDFTRQFDEVDLTPRTMKVDPAVCRRAWDALPANLAAALEFAADGIRRFHKRQLRTGFTMKRGGTELTQRIRPLRAAGVYVPGGRATYPSTLLMNVIPAQVAGVREITVVTPPVKQNPETFVPFAAAHLLGVSDHIFQVGGAQAVAGLAFGTRTLSKVDKIVGPGNAFVATAKRMLYGVIDIDSVAGESEVLIIADCDANPAFIAADLLAQAEHTGGETVVLVGLGKDFDFAAVEAEIKKQLAAAPRREQAAKSLKEGGIFIRVETEADAAEVANLKAPEHMEVLTASPERIADQVDNAGAIFLGPYTPEPIGDYVAGPNHVLPTGGTARFFSPLGVDAFLKASNVLRFDKAAFRRAAPHTIALAECEGLHAHAESVRIRLAKDS